VQAASWTGGIANQNRGTLGGNIVNASPAADSAPALLAYDTEVEVASLRGMRWMDYAAYHTGYKKMRMEPDELLTRIRIPRPHGKWIEYGRKVGARKAQAISKLSVAARAKMDGRQVSDVRIAFASVAPMPLRCVETERALTAKVLSAETRQRAREALAAELSPIDDIRSTAEYRRRVAINLLDGFMDLLAPVRDMISHWNQLPAPAAEEQIRKCCGSARWAQQIASERPFAAPEHLISAADRVWAGLDLEDRLEAFRAHPRIGAVAPTKWAAYEQSGMSAAGGHVRQALESARRAKAPRKCWICYSNGSGTAARRKSKKHPSSSGRSCSSGYGNGWRSERNFHACAGRFVGEAGCGRQSAFGISGTSRVGTVDG
jgi:hypothetical protein